MTQNSFVQIRCRNGSLAGQTFCFIEPGTAPLPNPLRIGRHQDAHIRFFADAETMVSRLHAELHYDGSTCSLIDIGSTLGTYLMPTQERIKRLNISKGTNWDVQFGVNGPICHISFGGAVPFGPYLLISKLGEGGMGEVFVGWDTRLNRQVVLKLLREEMLGEIKDAQNLLLNEARIVSQLEHPNVVRVYDLGEQSGVLYLAMEYIRGVNLNELRRFNGFRDQRLPPALAAGIMHQVCLGLHAAHQLPIQVVHRDISPNNIMLTAEGVKVIDFGLARARNRIGVSFTEGGKIAGCPPYMSPEQIKTPQTVDRRSDIFSAGACRRL